jgi:iron complex outermembrane receptor protein
VSHGYKGGGFSMGQFDSFDPEYVDSVEVGFKSQFADNRAQVNVSAFYNDYQDLQVNFLVFTSFRTDNAAEATIKGIEVETLFVPTDQLTVSANFTWLDAEFDKYIFSTSGENLSGDTLNRAPEYTYEIAAQYDFDLGNFGTLSLRGDYYWQDDVYYTVQNIPRHRQDAFDLVNLKAVWTSEDEQFVVDAFMDNAQDEDNLRGILISSGTSIGDLPNWSFFPPKVYGVRVAWHYGAR